MGLHQPSLPGEKAVKGFAKGEAKHGDRLLQPGKEVKKSLQMVDQIHRKQKLNFESRAMAKVQQDMVQKEIDEKRAAKANRTMRRSEAGGRKRSKSGAALAALTGGVRGDKRSKREYKFKRDDGGRVSK